MNGSRSGAALLPGLGALEGLGAVLAAGWVAAGVLTAAPGMTQQTQLTRPAPPASSSTPDAFPEGTGKAALLRVCGNCHGVDTIVQTLRTRQEWSDVVDQMARYGAEASDQDFEQILGYLVKFYSPIRVNRATAKELAATLDIPAPDADAIVAFRQKNGAFKTIDDLKEVPGLNWAQIEARKARLVFTT
jgi:competence protein ComEA